MNIKTKKIFVSALISAFITGSALAYFFYLINSQALRLEEQINILTENQTKESAYTRLQRQVTETETERSELAKGFFRDENDSIIFLGEIESLATALNLSFETQTLEKVVDDRSQQESIKIAFVYEGQKDLVFEFTKLMEVIPYHSQVEVLSLREISSGNWEGRLTLFITINPL